MCSIFEPNVVRALDHWVWDSWPKFCCELQLHSTELLLLHSESDAFTFAAQECAVVCGADQQCIGDNKTGGMGAGPAP